MAFTEGTVTEFIIRDSGERQQFSGGMVRDTQEGKIDWLNLRFGPLYRRVAAHLTKGREKYPDPEPGVPNWTLARGPAEALRAKQSAARHFEAWLNGETDEDHAAGVVFNINLFEYVRELDPSIPPGFGTGGGLPGILTPPVEPEVEPAKCDECDVTWPHAHLPAELTAAAFNSVQEEEEDDFGSDFVYGGTASDGRDFRGAPRWDVCDHKGPTGWYCERPIGHTGDHGWPGFSVNGKTLRPDELRWPAE